MVFTLTNRRALLLNSGNNVFVDVSLLRVTVCVFHFPVLFFCYVMVDIAMSHEKGSKTKSFFS